MEHISFGKFFLGGWRFILKELMLYCIPSFYLSICVYLFVRLSLLRRFYQQIVLVFLKARFKVLIQFTTFLIYFWC